MGLASLAQYYLTYVIKRVKMEVDEVLGTKEQVTAEDLEKLQYTEQVIIMFVCLLCISRSLLLPFVTIIL